MTKKINMNIDALDNSIAQVQRIDTKRFLLERLLEAIFPLEDVDELEDATNTAMIFYYLGIEDYLGGELYEYMHLWDWKQRDISEFFKERCPYSIAASCSDQQPKKKLTLDELIAQAPDA